MKVILLKKVAGLGDVDQVRDVADGYARNFLFPNHLAVLAVAGAVQIVQERKNKSAKESVTNLHNQQSLAGRLDGMEVEIAGKANEGGKLYAAVTPQRIADQLGTMGFKVKPDHIITKPLKEVGTFPVIVKFGHGLESEITVIINSEP